MVKPLGGTWGTPEPNPGPVIDMLLPLDLRDFFLMDSDEAVALVGGSDENKVAPKSEYRKKTTDAINGLLGLDVFTDASDRVKNIGQKFSRKASKATGDKNLNQLEEDLGRTREALDRAYEKQEAKEEERETLSDELQQLRSTLADHIRQAGERYAWADRLEKVDEELDLATEDRTRHLAYLSENLESAEFLAGLGSTAIIQTQDFLRPLHRQGHIPSTHVPFVRGLLDDQSCVCGQDLVEGTAHRLRVEKRLADAAEEEKSADFLYQLYEASPPARALVFRFQLERKAGTPRSRVSRLHGTLQRTQKRKDGSLEQATRHRGRKDRHLPEPNRFPRKATRHS